MRTSFWGMRSRLTVVVGIFAILSLAGAAATSHQGARSHSMNAVGDQSTVSASFSLKTDTLLQSEVKRVSGEASVLAQLQGDLTPEQSARLASLQGKVYQRLPIIRGVALRIPRRNLSALANLPFVKHLSADTTVHKTDEFIVEGTGAGKAFSDYGLTGSGIGVAVLDSGIDRVADVKQGDDSGSRVVAFKDYVNPAAAKSVDECGHGTHIAGIIGGNGNKSTGEKYTRTFYGVARNANLINVRVLDSQGNGAVSDVIAGLGWVVQNKNRYNIRVVNLSLGHPVAEFSTTDPLCQAVEQVWKSGIVVVCSAGNYGRGASTQTAGAANEGWGNNYGSIQSPANDPYVITVGATKPFDTSSNKYNAAQRSGDKIATYSSRGPTVGELVLKPDILAPGNRIISTRPKDGYLPTVYPDNEVYRSWYIKNGKDDVRSKDYYVLSGTSMAAPVVAGAAALLLEKNPGLSPDSVKARLMVSADKWASPDGTTDPFTYGAGYLNIAKALTTRVQANGYALSPTVTVQSNGTLSIGQTGPHWYNNSLWGTGLTDLSNVWGGVNASASFTNSAGLWSTADKLQGDIILWGGGGDTVTPRGALTTKGGIILWGGGGDTIKPGIILWGGGGDTVKPTIILWGGGGDTVTPTIVLAGAGLSQVRQDIILWGGGGDTVTPIPVTSTNVLWGPNGNNALPSIILWGGGGDTVKPTIILWGGGGDTVKNDIILWGGGGDTVKSDIILWGGGGDTVRPVAINGEP